MSLKLVGDLILHLHSFRNIDLYKRGLYYYDISLSHTQSSLKISSPPYAILTKNPPQPKYFKNSPGCIEDQSYLSKTFEILYCDDCFEINEIVIFRFELDPGFFDYPSLTIKVKLMYCDSALLLDETVVFKEEISCLVNINYYSQGLNQFVPITFDILHACVLNTTVHVVPLDFRFRAKKIDGARLAGSDIPLDFIDSISDFLFPDGVNDQIRKLTINKYLRSLFNALQKISHFLKIWDKDIKLTDIFDVISLDSKVIAQAVFDQIQVFAENLCVAESEVLQLLQHQGLSVTIHLMHEYNNLLKDRLGESIFRKISHVQSFSSTGEEKLGEAHNRIAKKIRESEYYQTVNYLPISITSLFPSPKIHPILFVQICSKEQHPIEFKETWLNYLQSESNCHLVVLVHGFKGNSFDLRGVRNQVSLFNSSTRFLCSVINEKRTDDIEIMGQRLAKELINYLNNWRSSSNIEKISFIGHSLGGIVIRAALPYLSDFCSKFSFLITLSTPHLGYTYKSSALVGAGMWFIKKFQKSFVMRQLTMSDEKNIRNSFLFRLSQAPGLESFKHVAFVSSYQDEYAPFESARVEVGQKAIRDKGVMVIKEMADSVLGSITADKIYRINVDYKIVTGGVDKIIGRAAHIEMLNNESMISMVLHACASFFD